LAQIKNRGVVCYGGWAAAFFGEPAPRVGRGGALEWAGRVGNPFGRGSRKGEVHRGWVLHGAVVGRQGNGDGGAVR
jgi:hypothetical protein